MGSCRGRGAALLARYGRDKHSRVLLAASPRLGSGKAVKATARSAPAHNCTQRILQIRETSSSSAFQLLVRGHASIIEVSGRSSHTGSRKAPTWSGTLTGWTLGKVFHASTAGRPRHIYRSCLELSSTAVGLARDRLSAFQAFTDGFQYSYICCPEVLNLMLSFTSAIVSTRDLT